METKARVECMIMLKAVRVSLDSSMYTHTVYKYTVLYRDSLVFSLLFLPCNSILANHSLYFKIQQFEIAFCIL